jgi:hypothetical protein
VLNIVLRVNFHNCFCHFCAYFEGHISFAGGPIVGFAIDKVPQTVGYVSLGYPFGVAASTLFGRHHKAILQCPKPKPFVMVSPA